MGEPSGNLFSTILRKATKSNDKEINGKLAGLIHFSVLSSVFVSIVVCFPAIVLFERERATTRSKIVVVKAPFAANPSGAASENANAEGAASETSSTTGIHLDSPPYLVTAFMICVLFLLQ